MSDTDPEIQGDAPPVTETTTPGENPSVGKLMGDPLPDLEAEAAAAVEEAHEVLSEVAALQERGGAEANDPKAPQTQAAEPGDPTANGSAPTEQRERILRGVLLVNLLLMGVVLALPGGGGAGQADQGHQPGAGAAQPVAGSAGASAEQAGSHADGGLPHGDGHLGGDPHGQGGEHGTDTAGHEAAVHVPYAPGEPADPLLGDPIPIEGLSNDSRWKRAMNATDKGEYATAVDYLLELEKDLRAKIPPSRGSRIATHWHLLLNQVRQALAWNLQQDDRDEEALAWSRLVQQSFTTNFLPADYLKMAWQAEVEGNGKDMRRYYARFLLSQKLHSTEQRKFQPEAYLKLGDSFRQEALDAERRLNPPRAPLPDITEPEPEQPPEGGHGGHGGGH